MTLFKISYVTTGGQKWDFDDEASKRYGDLLPNLVYNAETQKKNRNVMHDPYDIPSWCPLENFI